MRMARSPQVEVDDLLPGATVQRWQSAISGLAGNDCGELFADALRRTLARTLHRLDDGTVFVITGDIPAMWLRDSSTQLLPYLRLVAEEADGPLADLIAGVVRRQLIMIAHDPYANAFNLEPNGRCHDPEDLSDDPWLWERKYEIDSLSFPFQLAARLWRVTGRTDHLDEVFLRAFRAALDTLDRETRHEERSTYRFVRRGGPASETLARGGLGSPVGWTGLTWSGFRPSDDACTLGYNIPGNLMVAHTLATVAELLRTVFGESGAELADDALRLGGQIERAVYEHGIVDHPEFGAVLAYEVDGLGGHVLMDDANMPGLLSLPLVSAIGAGDPLYRRTRSLVLSDHNPYHYRGRIASGIGSPHTPPNQVWPIALAVEGLTETDPDRALTLLRRIAATTGGTGYVHESFAVDDDRVFTRPWFSWADSMFCELAMDLVGSPSA